MGIEPPPRALAIWRARPDLQAIFDLGQLQGRQSLAQWYFLEAYREMGLSPDPRYDEAAAANRPYGDLPRFFDIPVTWLMRQLWARRQARRATGAQRYLRWLLSPIAQLFRRRHSLKTRGGQARFFSWYFTHGLADARLVPFLTADQARFLKAPDPNHAGIPRILAWIWEQDGAVAARFASPTEEEFLAWAAHEGAIIWPILAHPAVGIAKTRVTPALSMIRFPFGVNLIGHARGRSGISEDLRMAARALHTAGIPHVVHELGNAENIPAEDDSVTHLLSDELPYAINLFCVTAMDTVAAVATRGRNFREGRYTIGFWPWELPRWPALWAHAYDFVDEVWASSRFTFDAHQSLASKPLRHMPMAVSIDDSAGWTRSNLGVSESAFVFSFAFDGLSSFSRKNPQACLAAFLSAFPLGNEPVALILKGLRVDEHSAWHSLRLAAEVDPRIVLIGDSLPRGALLDLHRMTDCFVSLHRAEGFGRNIAECMSLGKPVIVTEYSGNMDFTVPNGAALVPASPRDLGVGEYPFGEGQSWADPDVDAAADMMRRMVADSSWRATLAANGRQRVQDMYAAKVVGAVYAEALREIWDLKNKVGTQQ
jgi:glycosyltransferase involved in cell wall biosynthesis